MVKPHLYKEIQKISQAWWCAPIVPATQEAEVRGSLDPGRWRMQGANIIPLYSSLGNRERHCLRKEGPRYTQIKIMYTQSCVLIIKVENLGSVEKVINRND